MTENYCEIFKTGTHTDSKGNTQTWIRKDLEKIVSNFEHNNPDVPICCGHTKTNSPAYGWVDKLKIEGDKLLCTFKNVQDEFKEAVKKGLFKTRSISLSPELVLRHVAFLGAQPPAIKGMEQFCFEENDTDITYEFQDEPKENTMTEDLEKAQEELKKSKEENEKLKKELEQEKQKAKTKEFEDFCENAIKEGHILPSQKEGIMNIFEAISNTAMEFSEDEIAPVEHFKTFLGTLKQIDFSESADPKNLQENKNLDFSDTNALAGAIRKTQKEYLDNQGIEISPSKALEILRR